MLRPSISVGDFTDTALQTTEQAEEESLLLLLFPPFLFLTNLKDVVVGPTQVVCFKVRGEESAIKRSDLVLMREDVSGLMR